MKNIKFAYQSVISAAIIGLGFISSSSAMAEIGVTQTSVKIGTVQDTSGSNKATGISVLEGMKAYIDKINASGGVSGRKIEVVNYDDGYDPKQTLEATKKLIEQDKVFALTNYLGTSNAQAALPIILKDGVPFVGSRTGAEFLRAPLKKPVFNVRASYFKEVDALVDHLTKDLGSKNIAVLHQNDGFGEAGKVGLERALMRRGMKPAAMVAYDKADPSNIESAYAQIKAAKPDAVILASLTSTATAFIKKSHHDKLGAKIAGISSIGSAFLRDLKPDESDGVFVSSVFPEPAESTIKIVVEFKADMTKSGFKNANSIAFEGYMNAVVLVEGMKLAGVDLTRASLIKSLEGINKDAGGFKIEFSESDHEAMSDLYFSRASGGKFVSIKSFK